MPISIFRAGETITPGNIVAVTQNSVVKKASVNDPETFRAIGVATTSGYAGDAVKVVVDDQVHIFSGLTPGSQLYLSPTPGLYTTSYTTITSGVGLSLNGSSNLSPFARAISASGITLQTPAAVVADVSSEIVVLENTPTNNIFSFLTEYGLDVAKESGITAYAPLDPDAYVYIRSVEIADGQFLEDDVCRAIDNFVIGCKQDGIWSAIKASCILAGARTLNGALQPLVGTAPTNNNFVSGDYDRKTGLGDATNTTKYLDSNRSGTDDPNTNGHMSVYATTVVPNAAVIGYYQLAPSISYGYLYNATTGTNYSLKTNNQTANIGTQGPALYGVTKAGVTPGKLDARLNNQDFTATFADTASPALNYHVFERNSPGISTLRSKSRIAFYSIGESLDLAKLDARVTALINAFAAAIP